MIDTECRNAGIGCVDCKKILAKNMETEMAPIQEKYDDLAKRPDDVKDALAKGAQRVKALSQDTMAEVRENLGLR
jgi:tryptophanyl-tRNA synthetase